MYRGVRFRHQQAIPFRPLKMWINLTGVSNVIPCCVGEGNNNHLHKRLLQEPFDSPGIFRTLPLNVHHQHDGSICYNSRSAPMYREECDRTHGNINQQRDIQLMMGTIWDVLHTNILPTDNIPDSITCLYLALMLFWIFPTGSHLLVSNDSYYSLFNCRASCTTTWSAGKGLQDNSLLRGSLVYIFLSQLLQEHVGCTLLNHLTHSPPKDSPPAATVQSYVFHVHCLSFALFSRVVCIYPSTRSCSRSLPLKSHIRSYFRLWNAQCTYWLHMVARG